MRIFRKEPQQGTNADGKQDLLRHQYEQICQSYYKIEEFRGRLLALWPILGGAAGGKVARQLEEDMNLEKDQS